MADAVDERRLHRRAIVIVTASLIVAVLVPVLGPRVLRDTRPPQLVALNPGAPDLEIIFRDKTPANIRDALIAKCASIPGALNEPDRVPKVQSFRPIDAVIGVSPNAEQAVLGCLKADPAVEQVAIPR